MASQVIVTEVDPIRAIEATLDGYRVMTMAEAARIGDIFVTLTGDIHVLRKEHFEKMKDGAIIANSGHFNVEINLDELAAMSKAQNKAVRPFVDEFVQGDGRRLYVLGEGRLINLAAAEGHPAAVMDMSFATQALATEFVIKNAKKLEPKVYNVPRDIENWIATLKLKSMGITIDELTVEQKKYLSSWEMGT
jgi:adenosylhomocysteinase